MKIKSSAWCRKISALLMWAVLLTDMPVWGMCAENASLTAKLDEKPDRRYGFAFSLKETEEACGTVIDKIVITGNYITKPFVMLQEIPFSEGDTLTMQGLQVAQQQIYNLQLFNVVFVSARRFLPDQPPESISINDEQDSAFALFVQQCYEEAQARQAPITVVLVSVHERWYLFPQPRFDLRGVSLANWIRNPTIANINAGIITTHQNFTGLNDPLSIAFGVGFDPYIRLSYYTPYLFGTSRTGAGFAFTWRDLNNLAYDTRTDVIPRYIQKTFIVTGAISQRLSPFAFLNVNFGFNRVSVFEETKAAYPSATVSADGRDYYPWLHLNYTYSQVDFNQCPTKGWFLSLNLFQLGLPTWADKINITRGIFDIRFYEKLIGELALALRNYTAVSLNTPVPNHERLFFGYTRLVVRGYTRDIFEGDNLQFNSAELRYPIVPLSILRFDFIPIEQFKVMQWALYATLFFDAGNIWYNSRTMFFGNRPTTFNWQNMQYGYGAGLLLVGGYRIAARVDFAWNNRGAIDILFDNIVSF